VVSSDSIEVRAARVDDAGALGLGAEPRLDHHRERVGALGAHLGLAAPWRTAKA
jgi:hypothetical protein